MKVVEEITIWWRCKCRHCEATNWVYSGYFPDPDMSKMDPDGFECWRCGKETAFVVEEAPYVTETEMCNIEPGLERPKLGV